MTFRCLNGQYHLERIPLSQNIEYKIHTKNLHCKRMKAQTE